jgi:hypothetical protein
VEDRVPVGHEPFLSTSIGLGCYWARTAQTAQPCGFRGSRASPFDWSVLAGIGCCCRGATHVAIPAKCVTEAMSTTPSSCRASRCILGGGHASRLPTTARLRSRVSGPRCLHRGFRIALSRERQSTGRRAIHSSNHPVDSRRPDSSWSRHRPDWLLGQRGAALRWMPGESLGRDDRGCRAGCLVSVVRSDRCAHPEKGKAWLIRPAHGHDWPRLWPSPERLEPGWRPWGQRFVSRFHQVTTCQTGTRQARPERIFRLKCCAPSGSQDVAFLGDD